MKLSLDLKEIDHFINKYKYVNTVFYYGCHMPIAHNIEHAIIGINKMGGNCLQVFVSSPMSGQVSEKSYKYYLENGPHIKKMLSDYGSKLFIHSPYTFNFAKNPVKNNCNNCLLNSLSFLLLSGNKYSSNIFGVIFL